MQLEQLYLLAVSLVLAVFVFGLLVWAVPAAGAGFEWKRFEYLGWKTILVQLTAQQRNDFLRRCVGLDSADQLAMLVKDLQVVVDLGSLHLRRWYLPMWFVRWRLRRLPGDLLARLFAECVALSNLPFDIKPVEPEPEPDLSAIDREIAGDDDWDFIEQEPEKKSSPAVRQSDLVTS